MQNTLVTGKEPAVDRELAVSLGLSGEEYERIISILGRVPTYTELGIYSVMWSEHCSYKNSIAVLKTLPRTGGRLLVGAGEENAGLVDLGNGLAAAFKIESHNHPSAIEPYQGAATGVGGIMRDIFTMGARPTAALNSLRFGLLTDERTRFLVKGVVKGIGDYGNCFGVPTVAGEVYFDSCYRDNPIVNAMAVGIVKHGEWASAVAKGVGNPVLIVGSSTGRDGIHGATFASEEISAESGAKRPAVQVGDPFTEKLLLEATLEAIRSGLVVGIQDMGAAGITCSTAEMSARGRSGMIIDLDAVPVRETGMSAYEIMLSESQERMLVVVQKGFERDVQEIFERWDLHAAIIGQVTDTGHVEIQHEGQRVVNVPAESLVLGGGAPVYVREERVPAYLAQARLFDAASLPEPENLNEVLLQLLRSPNVCSRQWVYEQYDHMVRTNNVVITGGDAALILLKSGHSGISLKTDCNARYVYLNPRRGGMIAVAESARNVVCSGGVPIAITNCLNFGNPYKPEVYWQFKEAVLGIGEACSVLETPVTGGNVSFYNDSPEGSIYPTPVIGMLGLVDDVRRAPRVGFVAEGDIVILIGRSHGHVGGSEYLAQVHGLVAGDAPEMDLAHERRVHLAVIECIQRCDVRSAHDCSEGGIAVALSEMCIAHRSSPIGMSAGLPDEKQRRDFQFFGEDQGRVILSVEPHQVHSIREIVLRHDVDARVIGRVGGKRLRIEGGIDVDVGKLGSAYFGSLEQSVSSLT